MTKPVPAAPSTDASKSVCAQGLGQLHADRLAVRGARKVYGGNIALAGADFAVRTHEIHALIGENGAGKSTLVRLMAGVEQADAGTIHVDGVEVRRRGRVTPGAVRAAGMVFIHQDLALVGQLSVTENIALLAGYAKKRRLINWRRCHAQAAQTLEQLGLDLDPSRPVGSLPVSSQAMVALARALALHARLLVLDEPTANLSDAEAERMHAVLRRMRSQGVSSVLISHRIDEVLALADRATVLRDGRVVATVKVGDTSKQELLELMLGPGGTGRSLTRSVKAHSSGRSATKGTVESGESLPIVQMIDVTADELGPISLELHGGTVTGVTGLAGSGCFALAEVLVGARRHRGHLQLRRRKYGPTSPNSASNAGIAFVPADRNADAAAPRLTLRENIFLNPAGRGFIRPSGERMEAARILEGYRVKPLNTEAEFSTLSGGNAQKVVLARALHRSPSVIVLCEPTAAVDVGARRQIHHRLRTAAYDGAAVLIASTDTAELAEVCDRVLVLDRGRIAASLERSELTLTTLRKAIQGHDAPVGRQ